jgi:undecaprenyl-diphosphatase
MTIWQAVILGLVQGLTEFLPVSSTAHLAIVPGLLGWSNPDLAFKAVIQLGTLAAVLWYFRTDIVAIACDTLAGRSRLGWMIAAGTVPVVALGLLFKDWIERMNASLHVMAGALIGVGALLALAEWRGRRRQRPRSMSDINWLDAVVVGFAQAVALIPGSSRSGCTIVGGLLRGLTRETAARFSFLLSLPAIFGAGVFEMRDIEWTSGVGTVNLLVATIVSGVVGYASIAFLLGYLRRHTMWLFIVYRMALGIGLLVWLARDTLAP